MIEPDFDYTPIAIKLKSDYGYNLFPLKGKKPAVRNWKKFIGVAQSKADVKRVFKKFYITGVGIVLHNTLRVIDIDGTNNKKIIDEILIALGLTKNYKHLVETGNGFHIYFYCADRNKEIEKYFKADKAYYVSKPKAKYKIKQLELRWANCYVVGPYSYHPSGKQYKFINGVPNKKAESIEANRIISTLKLFCPVKKEDNPKSAEIEFDSEKLEAVTSFLKRVHLHYPEWIHCGFACASIGEAGRKYFLNMSINKFYPDDTVEYLNKQFDIILKTYTKNKTTLGTLFHYAQRSGYKIPKRSKKRSAEFLEFVLCALSYPEKNKKELLKIILHYSVIEKLNTLTDDKEKRYHRDKMKKRLQIYDDDKIMDSNHNKLEKYISVQIKKYGPEPYCRIGEDFFLETVQGKFDYLTFALLCAITAIQGKRDGWKTITKNRMRAAIDGYKSFAIFNKESMSKKWISDYKIRDRVQKLRELKIISHITVFRNSYYSTYLPQKQLMELAESRYYKNYLKKLENESLEKEMLTKIKENKLRIKKQFQQNGKRIPNRISDQNLFQIN